MKIKANGISVNYQIKGKGANLVLIHGAGDNLNMWYHQLPVFSKSYRVITYDIRGSGKTESPKGEYSISLFVEDAYQLMKAIKLEKFEERVFSDGATPTVVFEPTGLAWIPMAVYLRARHPECQMVKARLQKVAALRRYLRSYTKSDRVDGMTLAKMPFIDSEQLDEAYLPPAEYHALQRLTRQRERLMKSITIRKNRIGSIINGYLPDLRKAFSDEWSDRARGFYRQRLNPFTVIRDGKRALETFLVSVKAKGALTESHRVYQACQNLSEIC